MTPADALRLHGDEVGAGARVVLVHGFTQTSASWGPIVDDLAVDHRVVTIDAPGHGASSAVRADLVLGARLLGERGGPATYVGYSMGGRLALRLALDRPDLVRGLVLVGATAGIDDPVDRAARRQADEALATRLEADGVDAFLESWLAQPLFEGLVPAEADLAGRRGNDAEGLASSLRSAGTGTMDPPWWPELGRLAAPTVVVAGQRDQKFTALGHRLVDAIGAGARFEAIAGAGHAAHLEQPAVVAELVRSFVASLPPT